MQRSAHFPLPVAGDAALTLQVLHVLPAHPASCQAPPWPWQQPSLPQPAAPTCHPTQHQAPAPSALSEQGLFPTLGPMGANADLPGALGEGLCATLFPNLSLSFALQRMDQLVLPGRDPGREPGGHGPRKQSLSRR